MARLKNIRARLHKENPRCCYCGKITILVEGKGLRRQDANEATIEHIESRLDGRLKGRNNLDNLTIACYKCNHTRGIEQEKALPRSEQIARGCRSGSALKSWFIAWEKDLARFDCW